MNRMEFMNTLEQLLSDISPSERAEAIQYYNDYFNDAGIENEQEVMASLDTPQAVAENIKAGLSEGDGIGEFTETGYRSGESTSDKAMMIRKERENARQTYTQGGDTERKETEEPAASKGDKKSEMSSGTIAVIVVLCIFAAPIVLPCIFGIGAAAIGIIIAILAILLALFVGFGATGLALMLTAIVLVGIGIAKMFTVPFAGLALVGCGLICAGFSMLFIMISIWTVSVFTPAFVQGIVYICSKLFGRKAGKEA